MKASHSAIARLLCLSSVLVASACIPAPDSTPAPAPSPVVQAPAPAPTPTATPTPAPVVAFENWIDAPQTPGDWSFKRENGNSFAQFGQSGSEPVFELFCNLSGGRVELIRYGSGMKPGVITVRTETTSRTISARLSPDAEVLGAGVPVRDPLLDAMALTRGRFAVETPELSTLYLPAWAEVTRVIEDCR